MRKNKGRVKLKENKTMDEEKNVEVPEEEKVETPPEEVEAEKV